MFDKRIKSIIYTISNQAAQSGVGLILNITILKYLTFLEYGTFGLSIAISVLFTGAISATLFVQHSVRYNVDTKNSSIYLLLTLFVFLACILLTCFFISILHFFFSFQSASSFGFTVICLTYSSVFRDFYIRYFYCENSARKAFFINLIYFILSILVIGSYIALIEVPSLLGLISSQTITATLVIIFAHIISKLKLRLSLSDSLLIFQLIKYDAFHALLAHLLISIRSQAHIFLTSSLFGLQGVALLNSARLLLTPLNMIVVSVCQFILPRASECSALGVQRAREMLFFLSLCILLCLIYFVSLYIFKSQFLQVIDVVETPYLLSLIFFWSIYSFMNIFKSYFETILISFREFRYQLKLNTLLLPLSIIFMYILYFEFSLIGVIISVIIIEVISIIGILKKIVKLDATQ